VLILALTALAFGAAWACLPDLTLSVAPVCGDGVIDPDAGEQCDPGLDGGSGLGCLGCLVSCTGGTLPFVDSTSHHCYFGLGGLANVSDAVTGCEEAGAHVVRFVSRAELAFVGGRAPTGPFWVGLEEGDAGSWLPIEPTNEPGWSGTCAGCYANTLGAKTIPLAEPDASSGACVASPVLPSESWTQSPCAAKPKDNITRETICEREPPGLRSRSCAGGACFTVAATLGAKTYVLGAKRVSARGAPAVCVAQGGKLVFFGTREEREQVASEVFAQRIVPGAEDVWIGLSGPAGGPWAWEGTDAGLQPLPWGDGQPIPLGGAGRAYLLTRADAGLLDSQLARAASAEDGGADLHLPLCERP
jgi:hypothetical protein